MDTFISYYLTIRQDNHWQCLNTSQNEIHNYFSFLRK